MLIARQNQIHISVRQLIPSDYKTYMSTQRVTLRMIAEKAGVFEYGLTGFAQ